MKGTTLFQLLRLVAMVAAVAGIIYALEFMRGGFAVWFWVALLGVGFVGLLWSFQSIRQRAARERRQPASRKKKHRR